MVLMRKIQDAMVRQAELVFLALTVWREARGEPREGKLGVAYSVLNRVSRPSWWGRDILSVIFRRLQYSSLTYGKDPQLTKWPEYAYDPAWLECLEVSSVAISGAEENPVPGADSYHDVSIGPPKWARQARFVKRIGRICFYDTDRDWERNDD